MGKTKTVSKKTPKPPFESKIVKKKSLVRLSVAKTPKLSLSRAKHISKALEFCASDDSFEFQSEAEVNSSADVNPSAEVQHFVAAPKSPIDLQQTESGVKALFEYAQKTSPNKFELFDDEQPIFLQITTIKVPRTPNRQVRFTLKHPLLSDSSEICLIVKDVGKAKDHDGTTEHYEELLKSKGIVNIKTIMPYHQFKTEYGNQYELVRKLLGLYDYFLVDGRVGGYVTHRLGKIFLEKRKMPTPVKMEASNLKEQFELSLKKTILKLHAKSDYYIVQVGHTKMNPTQVFENVSTIINQLDYLFPGGLDNIRSLGVKTDKSITIPVYLTLKNKTTVNVPVVLAKRPKQFKSATGELTTFLDRDVTVLPTGEIILSKQGSEDEKLAESDVDLIGSDFEDEEEGEDEEGKLPSDSDDVEEKEKSAENDVVEEGEGILDQAEEMYLNEYKEEQANTRRTKRTLKAESEAVPSKKGKKTPTVQKENVTSKQTKQKKEAEVAKQKKEPKVTKQEKEPKASKQNKASKTKKQEEVIGDDGVLARAEELYLNEYEQEQTITKSTRKLRANKAKPEKEEPPAKKTKKPAKKVRSTPVTDLKATKPRATKTGKTGTAPKIAEPEVTQKKATMKKQKGSAKTTEETEHMTKDPKKTEKKVKPKPEENNKQKTSKNTKSKDLKSEEVPKKGTRKVKVPEEVGQIVTGKKSKKVVQNSNKRHSEEAKEQKVKGPTFNAKAKKGKKENSTKRVLKVKVKSNK